MESTKSYYRRVARWNNILYKPCVATSTSNLRLNHLILHVHVKQSKSRFDKKILSTVLELLAGQQTSPQISERGNYKINITPKKSRTTHHAQVTLVHQKLFKFLDKYILTLPSMNPEKFFYFSDNSISYYWNSVTAFPSLEIIKSLVTRPIPLQIVQISRVLKK